MTKTTTLAEAMINASDQLTIELVQGDTLPPVALVRWHDQPTVSPPNRFDATAATVMRVLAAARDIGADQGR